MTDHESRIKKFLHPGEELILLTETDMDRNGSFGRRWLAVTGERVMTFSDDETRDGPEVELSLGDIKCVKTAHLVGQLVLEAETKKRKIELLRCSNSLSERFGKVAKSLTDAAKDGKRPECDLEEEESRTCKKCGRLLPEKGGFCPACLKKRQVLGRLWKYMQPYWPRMLVVSALIVCGTGVSLAPPLLVKVLVDDVLDGEGGASLLLVLVAGLALLRGGSLLFEMASGRLSAWLGSRIMHDVRFDFYQAVQALSLRRHDKTQTGALMSRLTYDTSMLNFFFIEVGTWIVPNVLQLVGISVILFVLKWKLALLVLLPAPAVAVLTMLFFRRLSGLYYKLWQRQAKMSARATDSISGMRVVKAFSQEPREVREFGDRSHELYRATFAAQGAWYGTYPVIWFVAALGTYLVWYFGGLSVLGEGMTIGTLMAFLALLGMFYYPIQLLTHFSDYANRAFCAAQRLFEITDADQEIYDDPKAEPLKGDKIGITFNDVHFGYVKDRPVLKGMSVEVKPGEMIGLVGKSGVGKTTITNLICRFYDADEGSIELNGVDIRNVKLRELRRHIGIVPQESFLFNGTIEDNIGYAKPGATREEVIRAAIAANAHGFTMRLPDGYDTRVGERGARLSGGEKQRIAIARAILHDPKILILDEATSSVDTETEQLIQEALAHLVKGRTTFAIAHRLSTLRNANRLLVLEDGKQVELGTHEELLAKGGIYRKLVDMQSKLSSIAAVGG